MPSCLLLVLLRVIAVVTVQLAPDFLDGELAMMGDNDHFRKKL